MVASYLRRIDRRDKAIVAAEIKCPLVKYERKPVIETESPLEIAANDRHAKTYHGPSQSLKRARRWAQRSKLPEPLTPEKPYCKKALWLKTLIGHAGDACIFFPGSHPGFRQQVRFNYREIPASRAMCIWAHGLPEDPKHLAIHSCGNGHLSCINPKHVRWGSAKRNSADAKLHHGDVSLDDGATREAAEALRERHELTNVLSIECEIPAKVIRQIRNGLTFG